MNSSDDRLPGVGVYWIKEDDYPVLLKIFDDASKMPPTWKEWLTMAEEMERGRESAEELWRRRGCRGRHGEGQSR